MTQSESLINQEKIKNSNMSESDSSENDYDDDDLIVFQYDSKEIILRFSQLCQYSKLVRKKYLIDDVQNIFPNNLQRFQESSKIDLENIYYFFQLLKEDFHIKKNINLSFKQYIDLHKISEFLEIQKLPKKLFKYKNAHNFDVDFIIQTILYEAENQENTQNFQFQFNQEMEDVLINQFQICIHNENFPKLPISIVYRIFDKIDKNQISQDLVYDFIKKSIEKFGVLLSFVDVQKLSDEKFNDLCETFSIGGERLKVYLGYLKCDLKYIMQLRNNNTNLQKQLENSENEKCQMQKQLNDFQILLNDLESEKRQLNMKLNELQQELEYNKCRIEGTILAKVKNGPSFTARIKLLEKGTQLDSSRSKYIMSTSNADKLGESAYNDGEPITSLNQETIIFGGKSGTYYVRAFVVNIGGFSNEIVSNPIVLSGESISFDYVGEMKQVILEQGHYKLEVWGGKGGDSTGSRQQGNGGKGGLGGYSCGTLFLDSKTKIFVCVGGKGKSSGSIRCRLTFPDGGGAKPGHYDHYKSLPGTGGGSTSIRILSDSLYSRVIVAGGGGGASGSSYDTNDGGFGGGISGGNSHCGSLLRNEGAGTQIGSSPGPAGSGPAGVAGTFGEGATALYNKGCDSGGGGGGGWYGGGSGGYGGNTQCSSGGGGSGWVFTESSFNSWKSGDSMNASKFELKPKHYLADAITKEGNTSFPNTDGTGNETGHDGNGFAKITPL